MKRLNDLLSGKEKIVVDVVNATTINATTIDAPTIKSSGKNALTYDDTNNILDIGAYEFDSAYISSNEVIYLETNENGSAYLNDEGFVIDTPSGLNIATGRLQLPKYTSALRPGAAEGGIIYDSTLKKCILYNGTAWVNLDGTALA